MTQKTQNAVPGSTAFEECSAQQLNASNYSHTTQKVHREVQAIRLHQRFGMPSIRAALIASHAFNGGAHG